MLDDVLVPCRALEEALHRGNPGYGLLRSSGRLAGLTLHRVRQGTFDELKSWLVQQGASPAQVKVPRVLLRAELEAFAQGRVERTWGDAGAAANGTRSA